MQGRKQLGISLITKTSYLGFLIGAGAHVKKVVRRAELLKGCGAGPSSKGLLKGESKAYLGALVFVSFDAKHAGPKPSPVRIFFLPPSHNVASLVLHGVFQLPISEVSVTIHEYYKGVAFFQVCLTHAVFLGQISPVNLNRWQLVVEECSIQLLILGLQKLWCSPALLSDRKANAPKNCNQRNQGDGDTNAQTHEVIVLGLAACGHGTFVPLLLVHRC